MEAIAEYKLCKRGHERTPENTKKDGSCKTCAIEYQREWRALNPEKQKEYSRANWIQNREKETEKHRKWRLSNPEKTKERAKRFYGNHKENIKNRAKLWVSENRDRHNQNGKRWVAANPDKARSCRNRAARDATAKLSDGSVAKMLRLAKSQLPTELIEIKRLTIQLKRSLKNVNQISK